MANTNDDNCMHHVTGMCTRGLCRFFGLFICRFYAQRFHYYCPKCQYNSEDHKIFLRKIMLQGIYLYAYYTLYHY